MADVTREVNKYLDKISLLQNQKDELRKSREALADKIPGKVDENLCLHVSAPFEERSLLPSTKGFDAVKANVGSV